MTDDSLQATVFAIELLLTLVALYGAIVFFRRNPGVQGRSFIIIGLLLLTFEMIAPFCAAFVFSLMKPGSMEILDPFMTRFILVRGIGIVSIVIGVLRMLKASKRSLG